MLTLLYWNKFFDLRVRYLIEKIISITIRVGLKYLLRLGGPNEMRWLAKGLGIEDIVETTRSYHAIFITCAFVRGSAYIVIFKS